MLESACRLYFSGFRGWGVWELVGKGAVLIWQLLYCFGYREPFKGSLGTLGGRGDSKPPNIPKPLKSSGILHIWPTTIALAILEVWEVHRTALMLESACRLYFSGFRGWGVLEMGF